MGRAQLFFRAGPTLALALLLAGCGGLVWPPAGPGPGLANRPPPVSRFAERPPPATVVVRPGDSVFIIARRYGLSVRAVIDANRLRPPYRLAPGQRLRLPRPRIHAVVPGDTLYGISRRYGVDLYSLARLNRIGRPYRILVGRKLRLPVSAARPGQVAAKGVGSARPRAKPGATQSRPRRQPVPPPPPSRGEGFIWPVRGKLVSGFGPKGDGLHNDGFNVAAPRGTPVRAMQSGVVAYAGNQLRGFGNLLLIKHDGGWITAYAHADNILVRRGDRVGRGQVVARVGSTGNVTVPQIHFEIRRGKTAVDPKRYLRPAKA